MKMAAIVDVGIVLSVLVNIQSCLVVALTGMLEM